MAEQMSRRERVQAAVRGEATDRAPWSFWRHFYDRESSAADLAEAMVQWQRRYQFDLLKVNPRAQYHVEDWGARYRYTDDPHQRPERLQPAVSNEDGWRGLAPLNPTGGALGEQLQALRTIRAQLGPDQPMVQTLFLPIMVAGYLAESEPALQQAIASAPDAVHQALDVVADTYARYAEQCLEAGADGFFFATTWATPTKLSAAQYQEFGRPYDLRVIQAARAAGAHLNVLHVCGDGARVFDSADYPIELFSYAATSAANPGLDQTVGVLPGAVIGGLSPEAVIAPDPSLARDQTSQALETSGRRRWMLGGACSLSTHTRDENLWAAAEVLGIRGPA